MKFYFPLATQYTNQGDLLINVSLVQRLSFLGRVFVDFSKCELAFKQQFIELCIPYKNIIILEENIRSFRFLKSFLLRSSDDGKSVLVLPPGPKDWNKKRDIGQITRAVIRILWLESWKIAGGIVISIGNSIAIKSKHPDAISKIQIQQIDFLGLRNLEDIKHCKDYNLGNPFYFPDLAFYGKSNFKAVESTRIPKNQVILSFRNDSSLSPEHLSLVIDGLRSNVDRLKSAKFSFVSQTKEDHILALEYIQSCHCFDSEVIQAKVQNRNDHPYASADLVISNRLHVCLISMLIGTPFIFLSGPEHYRKTHTLLSSIGLSEFAYQLDYANNLHFASVVNLVISSDKNKFNEVIELQKHLGNLQLSNLAISLLSK